MVKSVSNFSQNFNVVSCQHELQLYAKFWTFIVWLEVPKNSLVVGNIQQFHMKTECLI